MPDDLFDFDADVLVVGTGGAGFPEPILAVPSKIEALAPQFQIEGRVSDKPESRFRSAVSP